MIATQWLAAAGLLEPSPPSFPLLMLLYPRAELSVAMPQSPDAGSLPRHIDPGQKSMTARVNGLSVQGTEGG